ncbi:YcxB family protein [Olsenella sp. YH-ols2217]|uniref:YcxB family protein n=1 Tax=Kribbibacterium absianum TaxID=3044210 RepID=A0ABT6ZKV9_9ACTN|nr:MULTISPECIES: YcxB family protein [unclassified Olsenella]MDJ1122839.1 YcxB family protein [Olsenella sp. YH-ols2216]MDJ1129178.1 YcxB family protein [Olsenella sp. YH-ols2217]
MARPKNQTPETPETDAEYTATYELTSLMTEECISLITPGGASNPPYLASAGVLVVLILYIVIMGDSANTLACLAGAGIAFALIYMGSHYRESQQKRLYNNGLDAVRLPSDRRRFTVNVWSDRVEVTDGFGEMEAYPLTDVKKILSSDQMIVLSMKDGGLVIIPRKALSLQRFTACKALLQEATGKSPKH